jgi:TorA maturation chaperone TorD
MSNPDGRPMLLAGPDEGEEVQRAELYGLLASVWLEPPSQPLLEAFAVAVTQAPEPDSFLEAPWHDLVAAMRATTVEAARVEFDTLFVGTGKAEIFPHASYQLTGALNEQPLVRLRTDLIELGLARDERSPDTEDHVAFVFEVMRYLIAGDDIEVCNLEQQRRFFRAHVQPWVATVLCDAVQQHPQARLYAAVAGFTRAFVLVETQGFDLIE